MKKTASIQKTNLYKERCEELAVYMIENRSTVRDTAARFGISKSTVHKDVTQKLERVSPKLYTAVKEILEINKAERHLRGGEATRIKYLRSEEKHNNKIL